MRIADALVAALENLRAHKLRSALTMLGMMFGVGAVIADRYSKLAREATPLPKELQALAWLGLDTELGQEYWTSMNLAGRFASACHHTIHEAARTALR